MSPTNARSSLLGFGCSGVGNHRRALTDLEAFEVLQDAWDAGVRLYDTAPHYGLGLSERRLGAFLRDKPRDSFQLSTKVGRTLVPVANPAGDLDDEGFIVPADVKRVWDFSEEGIRAQLAASMERLGVSHIETVYLHDPERWDLTTALSEGLPALAALRAEGVVGRIGIGSMVTDALIAAVESGLVDEIMVAGRYTVLDPEAEQRLLPACLRAGVRVVAAAVFNGGLGGSPGQQNVSFDYGDAPDAVQRRAAVVAELCAQAGVSPRALALQFPLRHPAVTTVVVGASRPGQIPSNLALLDEQIPDALWRALDAAAPLHKAVR